MSHINEVSLTNTGRGSWLLKVPQYIAQKWEKAPAGMDVGKLRICHEPGQEQVSLLLTPDVLAIDPHVKIASKHVVNMLLQESTSDLDTDNGSDKENIAVNSDTDKLSVERKLVCRPIENECYMKMKLETTRQASVDQLEPNCKPLSNAADNIECLEEGRKKRSGKHAVIDVLLLAFKENQYYHIKDLVRITNQPINYLRQILREICEQNMKQPHRFMWELKKEYLHDETKDCLSLEGKEEQKEVEKEEQKEVEKEEQKEEMKKIEREQTEEQKEVEKEEEKEVEKEEQKEEKKKEEREQTEEQKEEQKEVEKEVEKEEEKEVEKEDQKEEQKKVEKEEQKVEEKEVEKEEQKEVEKEEKKVEKKEQKEVEEEEKKEDMQKLKESSDLAKQKLNESCSDEQNKSSDSASA